MKNFHRSLFPALLLSLVCLSRSYAGVGTDNPTGVAGEYNGSITTGGSYDPYTGNAKRFVDDLTVTGSIGAYPLKWSRVLNTRGGNTASLGQGSSWSHSYNWGLWVRPNQGYHYYPDQYDLEGPGAAVYYPDGRTVTFALADEPYSYGPDPHVFEPQDRIVHMGDGNFDLLMRDGGRVKFTHPAGSTSGYDLKATAIVDPYGQWTVLTYDGAGRLSQVTEPGGRYLQINYTTYPWFWPPNETRYSDVITSVQAYSAPGQLTETVTYTYTPVNVWYFTYFYLTRADYDDLTHASYTYTNSNSGNVDYGVIQTCDDVRFAGPMKQIEYEYMTDSAHEISWGQIKREKNATTHQVVSEVTYPPYHGGALTAADFQRTETRGDGATRSFQYTMDGHGELVSYTDFKGQSAYVDYGGSPFGYSKILTDARGNATTIETETIAGKPIRLHHPDGSFEGFAYESPDGAPIYLQIHGDELGRNTYYTRDGNHRVTKIWYPDYPTGPTEEFSYNNFGQVLTHTMTSGGVENFRYDGRGLKYLSWPPPTPSDPSPDQHPTQYFYYNSGPQMDRLLSVVDPRGYSTQYEYNTRGQVTKVTHVQDGTYTQNGYNPDGTLAWAADENHPNASWNENERTRYAYDEYKRVISVTNPMNETTTNSYALDWANPLIHTTDSIKYTISPMNKNVVYDYDANFRKIDQVAAYNTPDVAWTLFEYDAVGNLTKTTDPRGNPTIFGYDNRNRRTSMTNVLNETTRFEYDEVNNKRKEIRPDNSFRRMEYDSMNRVIDTYGFANEHTHYERDLAGNARQTTDPKSATYFFDYDTMNRKTSATYPVDATGASRSEGWVFDVAGNLYQYTNPAGQTKTLDYDTRDRLINSSWNAGGGPAIGLGYDDASRLRIAVTHNAETNNLETTVVFGYDDANRQTWEEQTVAGYPTRRVETPRDSDGNRSSLNVPGGYAIQYDYTQRNQLWHINDGGGSQWFTYGYDPAGNMIQRQDVYGGVNDSTNIMDASRVSQYDALNRPTMWEQTSAGNAAFARSHFNYDNLSRLTASWRDEQANKGEWFGYNTTGQLTGVSYNADQVWTGSPQNASRTVTYTMTPDTLNRLSMNDSGDQSDYAPNALNQYQNVAGGDIYYDGNFNLMWTGGFSAGYDSANHLTAIGSGEDYGQFTYDGLGRCLKRTVDWETTLISYDGWKPAVEWDEWGNLKAWNIYGAGPDEILYRYDAARGVLRYHLDRMGNVVFLLDADGDGIERYTYDAFGKPTVTDWDGSNPRPWSAYGNRFMFTGREYFPELGLYDYRNRFYYPSLGRFLQSDPTGFDAGDMNLFRYCGDDPVDRSDPTGLDDRNYVPDWDIDTWNGAETRPISKSKITVAAHGLVTQMVNSNVTKRYWDAIKAKRIFGLPEHMQLSAKQLVNDVKSLPKYNPTIPIQLNICHAGDFKGADAYGRPAQAQEVANGFGTNSVIANTGDVNAYTNKGTGDWYRFSKDNSPVWIGGKGPAPDEGALAAGRGEGGRRTFDAYGSTTETAAEWESTWGNGGWLGIENRAVPEKNDGK